MQRRIVIGNVTYICNLSHDDETEYWSVANAKKLAEHLKKNGYKVMQVNDKDCPQSVWVKKNEHTFKGEIYFLNQCEGDLIDWVGSSMVNDFTYYYDKILFNTEQGFVAAYRDDINNNWKF